MSEFSIPQPRVAICTLIFNEAHWLPELYEQHKDWPGLAAWVFVEGCDRAYAAVNPGATEDGLSTDGTQEMLRSFLENDKHVFHSPVGFFGGVGDVNGKSGARNCYLEDLDTLAGLGHRFDLLVILDADEFYTHGDQQRINNAFQVADPNHQCLRFRNREVWFPPYYQKAVGPIPSGSHGDYYALFDREVTGGYWSVRHHRFWRWEPGLRYVTGRPDGHNFLVSPSGSLLHTSCFKYDLSPGTPECVHMGFASPAVSRKAKHAYYAARGEGREAVGRNRRDYVECRAAWETWKPGDALPHGAAVVPYRGPVPECFLNGGKS